jgi:uncharacterized coiled-coil DUF342 family protein
MRFEINKVILWPRLADHAPRVVEFKPGTVNVISGASQTGKSALIPIVDYCLGSGRCAIPVGTIRESCSWFGVLITTERGQTLLARREPGKQASTDDMFMREGETVEIPASIPDPNANRTFVKTYFDELAGLSSLPLTEGGANYQARPSFRDLAAFNFQPQNIIANPQVLFFKSDSTDHKEKLKNVMPYALGITTPEVIAMQAELADLKRERARLLRELDSLRHTAEEWKTELYSNISLARELGLLSPNTPLDISEEKAISLLWAIIAQADRRGSDPDFRPEPPSIESPAREIVSLRQEEQELALSLSIYRKRIVEMSKLREAAESYSKALSVEEDRLGVARWIAERASEAAGTCPICGNGLGGAHSHLAELLINLEDVEKGSAAFRSLPPSFDKEWAEVRQRASSLAEQLVSIQKRIADLQTISETERRKRYTELHTSRFIGKLESGLAIYERARADKEIRDRIIVLSTRISALAAEVDEGAIAARRRKALEALAGLMTPYLQALSVEGSSDPAELVTSELSLRISRTGRKDYLWEIGSASNWLGYHLSLFIALHLFFLSLRSSPVPSFLMLDQPSQVYFPQKLAGKKREDDLDPELADEDRIKVRAIFAQLAAGVAHSLNRLQLIVVDHATDEVWGGLAGIHRVDDWRGSRKLIPTEWIE